LCLLITSDYSRPIKAVWNPDFVNEDEKREYFQKIVDKFGKEIVNEEMALKALRKFEMDIDKIIEELEANKMTYRSFFEVRQKVLRSRVLHHLA